MLLLIFLLALSSCAVPEQTPPQPTGDLETRTPAPTGIPSSFSGSSPSFSEKEETERVSPVSPDGSFSSSGSFSQGDPSPSVSPTDVSTLLPTPTPTPTESSPSLPPEEGPVLRLDPYEGFTLGVWWWNSGDAAEDRRSEYLSFLKQNGVNEIYFCVGTMPKNRIGPFVSDCRALGMKVYWLAGDASFILPEIFNEETFCLADYFGYQDSAPPAERFDGLHLDVEPHQLPGFFADTQKYCDLYAAYVRGLSNKLRARGEYLALDVPFWFDNYEARVENESIPLLSLLSSLSDCLTVMSYRDSAGEIFALCAEEIDACAAGGCRIVFSVDCLSKEAPHVSFVHLGKAAMYSELRDLYDLALENGVPRPFGFAVHHMISWYELQDGASSDSP